MLYRTLSATRDPLGLLAVGISLILVTSTPGALAQSEDERPLIAEEQEDAHFTPYIPDFDIERVDVRHNIDLGVLVFQMQVRGEAGKTKPGPIGSYDGAPVLSYVFKTNLPPRAVGFRDAKGTLALMISSHPDFDWSPLWDEDGDGVYTNDGLAYQAHWVVLVENETVFVAPNYGVRSTVPPTAPKIPLYLDSPGFNVVFDDDELRVIVPTTRVGGKTSVSAKGMTALMRLAASQDTGTVLTVEHIYDEHDPSQHAPRSTDLDRH